MNFAVLKAMRISDLRHFGSNINGKNCTPIYGMLKAPMATAIKDIAITEHLARRQAVENALTDLRLEGLFPSDDVVKLLQRYADGDLNERDLLAAVLP